MIQSKPTYDAKYNKAIKPGIAYYRPKNNNSSDVRPISSHDTKRPTYQQSRHKTSDLSAVTTQNVRPISSHDTKRQNHQQLQHKTSELATVTTQNVRTSNSYNTKQRDRQFCRRKCYFEHAKLSTVFVCFLFVSCFCCCFLLLLLLLLAADLILLVFLFLQIEN